MASMFHDLFRFARAGTNDALENFTIEALAACTRDDPGPLLACLRAADSIPADLDPQEVVVLTQVPTQAGILDLVLQCRADGPAADVWIEVKVYAGETGDQLTRYLDHLLALPEADRTRLVLLGPTRLSTDPRVAWIPWQEMWNRLASPQTTSRLWLELRAFLEEIRMADAFNMPIAAGEAAALSPAMALFRKAERILMPFAAQANTIWPSSAWPSSSTEVRRMLARQFADHGRLTIYQRARLRGWVVAGLYQQDGEGWLGLWVETRPKDITTRNQIIEQSRAGRLPGTWCSSLGGWWGLSADVRLSDRPELEAARAWLVERLQELKAAGVLDLLPKLGAAPVEDDGDDEPGGEG